MSAVDFLKSKNLIKDGYSEFIITGHFGEVSLGNLLDEYSEKWKAEEHLKRIIGTLRVISRIIPEIIWDRYVQDTFYGFIYTKGKQRDFLVLNFQDTGVWFATSSAKYSESIAIVLESGGHLDCSYIRDLIPNDHVIETTEPKASENEA
jgi:hypothetical protein